MNIQDSTLRSLDEVSRVIEQQISDGTQNEIEKYLLSIEVGDTNALMVPPKYPQKASSASSGSSGVVKEIKETKASKLRKQSIHDTSSSPAKSVPPPAVSPKNPRDEEKSAKARVLEKDGRGSPVPYSYSNRLKEFLQANSKLAVSNGVRSKVETYAAESNAPRALIFRDLVQMTDSSQQHALLFCLGYESAKSSSCVEGVISPSMTSSSSNDDMKELKSKLDQILQNQKAMSDKLIQAHTEAVQVQMKEQSRQMTQLAEETLKPKSKRKSAKTKIFDKLSDENKEVFKNLVGSNFEAALAALEKGEKLSMVLSKYKQESEKDL